MRAYLKYQYADVVTIRPPSLTSSSKGITSSLGHPDTKLLDRAPNTIWAPRRPKGRNLTVAYLPLAELITVLNSVHP